MLARVRHSWNYTGDPEITLTQESDRGEIDRLRALLSGIQEKSGSEEEVTHVVTDILTDWEGGKSAYISHYGKKVIDELAVFAGDAERFVSQAGWQSLVVGGLGKDADYAAVVARSSRGSFLLTLYVEKTKRGRGVKQQLMVRVVRYLGWHGLSCDVPLQTCINKVVASPSHAELLKEAGFNVGTDTDPVVVTRDAMSPERTSAVTQSLTASAAVAAVFADLLDALLDEAAAKKVAEAEEEREGPEAVAGERTVDTSAEAVAAPPSAGSAHTGLRLPATGSAVPIRASGGCDARALVAAGVWASAEEATEALNGQIDVVWDRWCKCNPKKKRSAAGINDQEWAHQVVSGAVREARFHMIKVQSFVAGETELCHLDLRAILKEGGAFLLDGYINKSYKKRGKKSIPINIKRPGEVYNRSDHRHSVAVVDDEVIDAAFLPGGSMSADFLWLDAHSKADKKKGFLNEVLRAYRIMRCTQDGCEGCSSVPRKRKRNLLAR